MDWYYAKSNEKLGPVPEEEIRRLYSNAEIQRDTLVWSEGMPDWTALESALTLPPPTTPASVPTAVPTAGDTAAIHEGFLICAVSGKAFPRDQMLKIGEDYVSAESKNIYLQRIREGLAGKAPSLPYAGFWVRAGASVIDGIILLTMNLVIIFMPLILDPGSMFRPRANLTISIIVNVLPSLIAAAYYIFFVGKFGATLGKMACSIKVVRADGSRVTYGRSTGRYFAMIVSQLTFGIGYLMAAFDDEKRTLHDRICDTRVIHK